MGSSTHFSQQALVFNGIHFPEEIIVTGYAAIIHQLHLPIPFPNTLTVVSLGAKKVLTSNFTIVPNSYKVDESNGISEIESLYKHLVFSLKYEGVNLLLFSALTRHYTEKQLIQLINIEPTGQYSRRIWFLIEWLLQKELPGISDLNKKGYVEVVDTTLQYAVSGIRSTRHLVVNNLPGTIDFCPLICKTKKLENYISQNLENSNYISNLRKDVLQRASAFLLLKDSRASFTIEGESPKSKRAARWGHAIGQAGQRDLSHEELVRLQQIVIENPRFIDTGYRQKGGFIGEHDRTTGEPMPDHISAKYQDIERLMNGLLATEKLLLQNDIDAVLCAAVIAFGFVFIHPFQDGNGRIHRCLIHHILAKKKFSHQGIIFPVSAAILDKIDDYRKVLENYSLPLLDFIEWKETKEHNVEVINDTLDYYRYFDATRQAEFLYDCVIETIQHIIPAEVGYLSRFDEFKKVMEDDFEMPDKMVAMLVKFLEQNNGTLSKRAREKEFVKLSDQEIESIEKTYMEIFNDKPNN